MTKLGKKNQKRVAKLVAAALMCAGGGLFSLPSVASAEEVTVKNVTNTSTTIFPQYVIESTPVDGMTDPSGGTSPRAFIFYPKSANVLNITGTFNATDPYLSARFYGGYSESGTVSGKTVNITGTGTNIVIFHIAGGFAANGVSVTGNYVNFLGGTTGAQSICGGLGPGNGSKVSDNHVTIAEGSTVKYGDGNYGVAIVGGSGNGDMDANTVTISGTLTSADKSNSNYLNVLGGETNGEGKNATGNSVTISGATFNTGAIDGLVIIGGAAMNRVNGLTGEIETFSGNATGNHVTISGNNTFGEGTWEIYGGKSDSGTANDNTVEISGGTIKGRIYGGSGSTEASRNTVTIEKDAVLSSDTRIYGGWAMDSGSNNTVNILKAINVKHIMVGGEGEGTGNTLNVNAIA